MYPSLGKVMRAALLASALACGAVHAQAAEMTVKLSGTNEVPPVTSSASAIGKFMVSEDGSVSGTISTTGITATAVHLHEGAAGKSGGVVVSLVKDGDVFKVPEGTKLTEAQMASLKAGNMYVNVHSAANPKGELRAQLN